MALQSARFGLFIESIIRVPPFYIVDEILKSSFIFPVSLEDKQNGSDLLADQTTDDNIIADGASNMLSWMGYVIAMICCWLIILTVTLNKKELIAIYLYCISVFMVYFSYQRNVIFLNYLTHVETHSTDTAAFYWIDGAFVKLVVIQFCLNFAYQYLNPAVFKDKWLSRSVLIDFLSLSILAMMPFPRWFLEIIPLKSLLLLFLTTFILFWSNARAIFSSIIDGWRFCRRLIGAGLRAEGMLLVKWSKLHLTAALRIFWISRLLDHTINYIVENDLSEKMDGSFSLYNWNENIASVLSVFIEMVQSVLSSGCDTFIAVVGMASCLSYIFQKLSFLFQNILLVDNPRKHFGTISGLLFGILALETGLTDLEPEKRISWLVRTSSLQFSFLLLVVHKVLNPMLVSLGTLHNARLHKHIRALLMSAFIILYPSVLLVFLWRSNSISSWLLGVSAFNLKVVVKMIVSLTIYSMFIVDFFRGTFGENLDDYVYYIDSFGSTIEFCFGILMFCKGCWVLVYECGSLIRAVAMCFYGYFNIWFVAKAGWSSFMKRRKAVQKIDQLQDAKPDELADLEDICAICYQPLRTAKITPCRHFFHAICLRKWQYLQDYCPICHRKLYPQEAKKQPC